MGYHVAPESGVRPEEKRINRCCARGNSRYIIDGAHLKEPREGEGGERKRHMPANDILRNLKDRARERYAGCDWMRVTSWLIGFN